MKWTDDRKAFIDGLFHNKRLIFKNIGEDCLIVNHERDNLLNYDYMIMALESRNCYLVCLANLHSTNNSSSFKSVCSYLGGNKIIAVAKKINLDGRNTSLYEKVFIVPFSKIESFADRADKYFESYNAVNETDYMRYAYYDRDEKLVKC